MSKSDVQKSHIDVGLGEKKNMKHGQTVLEAAEMPEMSEYGGSERRGVR